MLTAKSLTYQIYEKRLIDSFSLAFQCGRIYALLGGNGSGKSTLLKLLGGLLSPSKGRVFFKNQDLALQNRTWISQHISFISPLHHLPYPYTVLELVQMGGYATAYPKSPLECLKEVSGEHLSERIFNTLSDGEKQRVLIAQSIVNNCSIMLLDEPTSHLDLFHSHEIWKLLKRLSVEGKTLIIATHDLEASQQFCDETILLKNGLYNSIPKGYAELKDFLLLPQN